MKRVKTEEERVVKIPHDLCFVCKVFGMPEQ